MKHVCRSDDQFFAIEPVGAIWGIDDCNIGHIIESPFCLLTAAGQWSWEVLENQI